MLVISLSLALLAGALADAIFSDNGGHSDDDSDNSDADNNDTTTRTPDPDDDIIEPEQESVTVVDGTSEHDWVVGSENNDSVSGGAGDDMLIGMEGNDTIEGDEGNDFLAGGEGSDLLLGGLGADFIDGREQSSEAHSATEPRTLGRDTLIGGEGNDVLVLDDGDRAEGGEGEDVFIVDGTQYLQDTSSQTYDESGVVMITDFEMSEDKIVIRIPDEYLGDQEISIVQDELDGEYSLVLIDGVQVAQVHATVEDLRDGILVLPESSFDPAFVGVGGAWR